MSKFIIRTTRSDRQCSTVDNAYNDTEMEAACRAALADIPRGVSASVLVFRGANVVRLITVKEDMTVTLKNYK